jgi:hypothetical protein
MSTTEPPADSGRATVWQFMRTRENAWGALKVSSVVGTVLNLLNNAPTWWQGDSVSLWRVLLNYAVPYCVSSYSMARNQVGETDVRRQAPPE